jgi:hypothetical protein
MDTFLNVIMPAFIKLLSGLFVVGVFGAMIAFTFTIADNIRTFLMAQRPERTIDANSDRA